MNNSYKSYGVWQGVREDPGWRPGRIEGNQRGGLGGGKGSGGDWGFRDLEGVRVSRGGLGTRRGQGVWGLGGLGGG